MKIKGLMTFALLVMAMSASAQVQLLFFDGGRHVIERNKKLYWMDAGDEDPCFDIVNYKKAGNKETFTLKRKEKENDGSPATYNATLIVDGDKTVELNVSGKGSYGAQKFSGKVRNTSGDDYEDDRLKKYFNGLAGNPTTDASMPVGNGKMNAPTSVKDVKEQGAKGTADKVKDAAKGAFGKVKGVFGKKKK